LIPVYGVYISQLIRYPRACGSYQDFLDRGLLLTWQLLNQEFLLIKLKSSLQFFTVPTMTWLTVMEYLCHKWPRICSFCRNHNPVLSSFMTYPRVYYKSNITGATSGAGIAYRSEAHEFTPVFSKAYVAQSLILCIVFCISLFGFFSFFVLIACLSVYGVWSLLCFLQTFLRSISLRHREP